MGSPWSLLVCLALCFLTAAFGAAFKPGPWYEVLHKPDWTPPDKAFPIVWSLLYLLMAFAAWRVWSTVGLERAALAATLFLVQLALNAAWSWLFFGLHRIGIALIEIGVLWVAVALTIVFFARHSALAASLLAPYLVWLTVAVALNWRIWQLNPS